LTKLCLSHEMLLNLFQDVMPIFQLALKGFLQSPATWQLNKRCLKVSSVG
jgi:hypothetical protein